VTARPRGLLLVGTDTAVGKTHVACALLRAARARGLRAVPFKPAESGLAGVEDARTDSARLLAAAGLSPADRDLVCPLRYADPLAPGVAHDPARFAPGAPPPDPAPLHACLDVLRRLVARHDPDLVVVEPAGGLHVPMPGGTWQPAWLAALDEALGPGCPTVIVARAGLGTLNHTLLTRDALLRAGHRVLGFILNATTPADASARTNAGVLAAVGLPHLATIAHGAADLAAADAATLFARLRSPTPP